MWCWTPTSEIRDKFWVYSLQYQYLLYTNSHKHTHTLRERHTLQFLYPLSPFVAQPSITFKYFPGKKGEPTHTRADINTFAVQNTSYKLQKVIKEPLLTQWTALFHDSERQPSYSSPDREIVSGYSLRLMNTIYHGPSVTVASTQLCQSDKILARAFKMTRIKGNRGSLLNHLFSV